MGSALWPLPDSGFLSPWSRWPCVTLDKQCWKLFSLSLCLSSLHFPSFWKAHQVGYNASTPNEKKKERENDLSGGTLLPSENFPLFKIQQRDQDVVLLTTLTVTGRPSLLPQQSLPFPTMLYFRIWSRFPDLQLLDHQGNASSIFVFPEKSLFLLAVGSIANIRCLIQRPQSETINNLRCTCSWLRKLPTWRGCIIDSLVGILGKFWEVAGNWRERQVGRKAEWRHVVCRAIPHDFVPWCLFSRDGCFLSSIFNHHRPHVSHLHCILSFSAFNLRLAARKMV